MILLDQDVTSTDMIEDWTAKTQQDSAEFFESWLRSLDLESSMCHDVGPTLKNHFRVKLQQEFQCAKGCSSEFLEPITVNGFLHIPAENCNTIEQSLGQVLRTEDDFLRNCGHCSSKIGSMTTNIETFPQLLLLQLTRFRKSKSSTKSRKIDNMITTPETLNFNEGGTSYRLTSAVVHMGNLSQGHYITLMRCPKTGNFFTVDDNKAVKPYDPRTNMLDQSYLLVYKKNPTTVPVPDAVPEGEGQVQKGPIIDESQSRSSKSEDGGKGQGPLVHAPPRAAGVGRVLFPSSPQSPLPLKKRKVVTVPAQVPNIVPEQVPDAVLVPVPEGEGQVQQGAGVAGNNRAYEAVSVQDQVLGKVQQGAGPQGHNRAHDAVTVQDQVPVLAQPVHDAHVFPGSITGVIYLGPAGTGVWPDKKLKTTFWIAPELDQIVMVRSITECMLEEVKNETVKVMEENSGKGILFPILTFKGTEELGKNRMSQLKQGDTLLIHNKAVPEELREHSGKLWVCEVCGRDGGAKKNVERHKCKNGHPHRYLFSEILANVMTWGSNRDKYLKPYGCPLDHHGTGALTRSKEHKGAQQPLPLEEPLVRTPSRLIASPASRSSPRTPGTPSGRKRYIEALETVLSPNQEGREARQANIQASRTRFTAAMAPAQPGGSQSQAPHPAAGDQGQQSDLVQQEVRKRPKRHNGKPVYNYSDSEDLPKDISGSESEEDWNPNSAENDNVVDDNDENSAEQRAGKGIPESDEESSDENDAMLERQNARNLFREQMQERNKRDKNALSSDKWDCKCDKCVWMISQFIIRPGVEQSTSWNKFKHEASEDTLAMVLRGDTPTDPRLKKMWRDLASTPLDHYKGLQQFFAKMQKEAQETPSCRDKLDNGKLHIWQLLEFNKWNQIPFPEDPMPLIEQISSYGIQKFAYQGYRQLVDSTSLWLARRGPLGGVEKFYIETKRTDSESEQEWHDRTAENNRVSRDTRMKEMEHLARILNNMKKDKPWAKMDGGQVYMREIKETFNTEFCGQIRLNSECITKYLEHPLVVNFYDEMLAFASSEKVPTGPKMVYFTKHLLPTIHIKSGMRQEIWQNMRLKHWIEAIQGDECAFPFLDLSQVDLEEARKSGRVMEGFCEGEEIYFREDGFNPDHIVRDDPMMLDPDSRELLVGRACIVWNHKTGKRYPAIIWFSVYDCCYLRAYEAIRFRYLESIGMDGKDINLPFFINSKGDAYLNKSQAQMDWTWFKQINQCGDFTGHQGRKIMSDYIKSHKNAVMKEGREYAMCNTNSVDKLYYQSKIYKKQLAMTAAANYQQAVSGHNRAVSGVSGVVTTGKDVPYFQDNQREREKRAKLAVDIQARDKFFRAEEKSLVRVKPSLKRLITPHVRKALVDCLIACRGQSITSKGDMVDIFMSGDCVLSRGCCKLLLRMIFMLPSNLACVGILKENLLAYAELSEETSSMRKLEWAYAWKLLGVIMGLKKTKNCESKALIYSMARLNKAVEAENPLGYAFGNLNLRTSIRLMLSQEKTREEALNLGGENTQDLTMIGRLFGTFF